MRTIPGPFRPVLPTLPIPFRGFAWRRTQDIVAAGVWGAQRIEGLDTMLDKNVIAQIVQQVLQQINSEFTFSINTQVFSQSGAYVPSANLTSCIVEMVGGGGGGGGALGGINTAGNNTGWVVGGGGGSAGTYVRSAFSVQDVQGGMGVVIGAGGTGGPPTQGVTGGRGGTSSFGGLMLAEGGYGGSSNVIAANGALDPSFGQGADPGSASGNNNVGDVSTWGGPGQSGSTNFYDPAEQASGQSICWGGTGGDSYFSGTWAAVFQSSGGMDGKSGHLAGAGGSGAASAYTTNPQTGGVGASGYCVITEYIMSLSITGQGA